MTGLTFYFNDNLVPKSNKLAELTLRSGVGSSFNKEKSKSNIIFSRKGSRIDSNNKPTKTNTYLTHIFYASQFENNTMREVTVLDFSRESIKQILTAKSAIFDKNNSSWIFKDGNIISTDSFGQTTSIDFKQYLYPFVEAPIDLAKVPKDARDMSLKEALEAERIYKKIGDLKQIRKIRVRIQEKFTLPCTCLVFGLIGSILGSKSNLRSSKVRVWIKCNSDISILCDVIYMQFFGVKGLLLNIAAWSPVVISLGGGFYFLRKSNYM